MKKLGGIGLKIRLYLTKWGKMQDFEKLGVFYLGQKYDLAKAQTMEDLVLYDSADLVTHAVTIGMTGSGKTGLCLTLLEEAAMDGIPVIAIDPKGDIGNLLLTFPDLSAQSFLPWVDEDEARRQGISKEDLAAREAKNWSEGLKRTGQDGERISRLRENTQVSIYTPGGTAGLGVSILSFLSSPDEETREDAELFAERVASAATAVLSLLDMDGELASSREHILLSSIFSKVWLDGQDLELTRLVALVQDPPLTKVGAMDLESFYPSKERFNLALKLNNLFAAPGFANWLSGEPLDIDRMLYTEKGKPRISIFSISHLDDRQRMFFVTLLANQMISWMRSKSGTKSLRAIFYMDEIFGYFPPVANPPSKTPILTMLKQGRAFGLGLILATQNPVDLDYKGLSNAGTWFIGRLQTEQDKMRVLDALESSSSQAGGGFNRAAVMDTLSRLGKQVFLMNNVHEEAPVIFKTRWTMSYLKGPLNRQEMRSLTKGQAQAQAETQAVSVNVTAQAPAQVKTAVAQKPILAPEITQFFIPKSAACFSPERGEWCPFLLASAQVRYTDTKSALDIVQQKTYLIPVKDGAPIPVDFAKAREIKVNLNELASTAEESESARKYLDVPVSLAKAASFKTYSKDFANWIYTNGKYEILQCTASGEKALPGECERDFRIRLSQSTSEKRDQEVARMRAKYATRMQALEDRIRIAEAKLEAERNDARQKDLESAISIGATVLGAFMGRKMGSGTLGRATSAARGVNRAAKQRQDVDLAEDNLGALNEKLAALTGEFEEEARKVQAKYGGDSITAVSISPKKTNITVQAVGLAWVRG